ncbi:MAG: hypothetical protein V4489_01895 [Chlamydiota bacterium]
MKITIVDRLQAFSHRPGHEVMVPGTHFKLRVFPTLLECLDLCSLKKTSFAWDLKGPIYPFTVEQDLEKSCVRIYGESVQGYFRFVVRLEDDKIVLLVEKAPLKETMLKKDRIVLVEGVVGKKNPPLEKLFLGNNKQKDVDGMRVRRDLSELLPFWFFLGGMTPEVEEEKGEMTHLLDLIDEKIENRDKSVDTLFLSTYLAGLSSGFVPRAHDDEFQGIIPIETKALSALSILYRGSLSIRSLFFQEKEGIYHFLPCLPSQFPAGKMVGVKSLDGSTIDIEWTKHMIRRIQISIQKVGELNCTFNFGIKRYRVRRNLKDKGTILQVGETLKVRTGDTLWLDCFQT